MFFSLLKQGVNRGGVGSGFFIRRKKERGSMEKLKWVTSSGDVKKGILFSEEVSGGRDVRRV